MKQQRIKVSGYYNVVSERYTIDLGEYELAMITEAVRIAAGAAELLYDREEAIDLNRIAKKLGGIVQAEQNRRNNVKVNIK